MEYTPYIEQCLYRRNIKYYQLLRAPRSIVVIIFSRTDPYPRLPL